MKNIAPAFVVALALIGGASVSHKLTVSEQSSSAVVAAKATAFPIPTCPPDDPNACGMGGPPSASAGTSANQ